MSENNFHQWKMIPLYLVHRCLGKHFKFHSNLEISHSALCNFPKFYQELFFRQSKYLSSPVTFPSTVACQFILFKKHPKIDTKSIYFHDLSNNGLNFVSQIFYFNGSIKSWKYLKDQFRLKNNMQFQCCQIKHAMPQLWKDNINNFAGNLSDLSIQNHHLIKCDIILNLTWKNVKTRNSI